MKMDNDDSWIQAEIDRLESEPCYCEPCAATNCNPRIGCDACDGMGITTMCERCFQLEELKMSQHQARREIHGLGRSPS